MFPALRLPFFTPTVTAKPACNRFNTYCLSIDTPLWGWLGQRLKTTIRFRIDRVLIEKDIADMVADDLFRGKGESDATIRARLAGGFDFDINDLLNLSLILDDIDRDGGLLLLNQDDAYLLAGWVDHEVDTLKYWPGKYEMLAGQSQKLTLKEFDRLTGQLQQRLVATTMEQGWLSLPVYRQDSV